MNRPDPDDELIVRYFNRQEAPTAARLPDPGLLWWKSQIRARRAEVEAAFRPIAIVERIACILAAAMLLAGSTPYWDSIRRLPQLLFR